jgi:hypothetical protein
MTPYDSYRLYQLERANSPAQARCADERAGRLAAATSALLRGIIGRARAVRPFPSAGRPGAPRPAGPAGRPGRIIETTEG